ncbi:jg23263 [Pararge aegeria aegeria]|uniref:Jg23263 protein n=1 Tax=Pararge aegeria aegeria TaxID=348720 RepID=A0A8S4QSN2_9NEOP|nr:jg23263 [Pararge aegeria aegeria]
MKRILTCLLVFAFVTISNCKQFRCDYKYFNKADGWMDFSLIFSKRVEYTNPQRGGRNPPCHCGSKLASPLNHNLASAMLSVVTEASIKCGLYTGIHAFFSKGDFHSIEGIPLSKIPHTWVEGEPDNDNNNESCLLMLSTGELADVNCSEPLPYLCYRKSRRAVLNSCGTVDNGLSQALMKRSYIFVYIIVTGW